MHPALVLSGLKFQTSLTAHRKGVHAECFLVDLRLHTFRNNNRKSSQRLREDRQYAPNPLVLSSEISRVFRTPRKRT
jgi:hypothetical protein